MKTHDDLAGLVAQARYMVGNTSAWEGYDESASEMIRSLADAIEALAAENARLSVSEPQCAVVKPLRWDHDGRLLRLDDTMRMGKGYNWDAYECLRQEAYGHDCGYIIWPDSYVANSWNIYGTHDGLYVQGLGSEDAAKDAAQVDNETRILSAITLRTEAEVRAEAWAAAIEAAYKAAHDRTPEKHGGAPLAAHCTGASIENAIRAMITDDASAALDRIKAEAKAEGMREAASLKYDPKYGNDWLGMSCAILSSIPEGSVDRP